VSTDKSLFAILIGMVAGPTSEIFTQIMKHFGLTNLSSQEAVSLMWLREPSWLLGILGALGLGAWVSLIMYYSVKIWGTDYFPIKAILIGMTSESLIFNIFGVLGRNELLVQDVSGNCVHATAAALAGLAVGFLMKKFLFDGTSEENDKV
jgi:hypothetical protein